MGRITHIAEVVNKTGLGTASAMLTGGFVLVTEPGAPGIGSVDRLLFPEDHVVLCAYLGPISTREFYLVRIWPTGQPCGAQGDGHYPPETGFEHVSE